MQAHSCGLQVAFEDLDSLIFSKLLQYNYMVPQPNAVFLNSAC